MQISTRLLLRMALALVALTAPRAATPEPSATIATTATTVSSHHIVAGAVTSTPAQTAKEPQAQTAKEPQPQTAKGPQAHAAKESQPKPVAEFIKLDAATL